MHARLRHRRRWHTAAATALLLGLVACGGSDDDAPTTGNEGTTPPLPAATAPPASPVPKFTYAPDPQVCAWVDAHVKPFQWPATTVGPRTWPEVAPVITMPIRYATRRARRTTRSSQTTGCCRPITPGRHRRWVYRPPPSRIRQTAVPCGDLTPDSGRSNWPARMTSRSTASAIPASVPTCRTRSLPGWRMSSTPCGSVKPISARRPTSSSLACSRPRCRPNAMHPPGSRPSP